MPILAAPAPAPEPARASPADASPIVRGRRFVPPPWRTAVVVLAVLFLAGAVEAAPPSPAPPGRAGRCLVPPVDAPVTDPFRLPPCRYCAGNRGIEYGPRPGQAVVAVAGGEVVFAGVVAAVRWVVVAHADGRRASYGHLASAAVGPGERVRAGQRVGTTTDRFYLGLRDGDDPVDPTLLLGRWQHRTRLVPDDGTPRPAPGPPRLVCANQGTRR